MTGETTRAPRRRRRAAVIATLLLVVGLGLLFYSATYLTSRSGDTQNAAPPIQATTMSPAVMIPAPSASPGSTGGPPPTPVVTYIAVPTYVPVPVASQESGLLPLITTISGLLASLAGIVSAVVSMRGARAR